MALLWFLLKLWWHLDRGLLDQCGNVVAGVEKDFAGENGDYKRARAAKVIAQNLGAAKADSAINFGIELALRMQNGR